MATTEDVRDCGVPFYGHSVDTNGLVSGYALQSGEPHTSSWMRMWIENETGKFEVIIDTVGIGTAGL